MGFINIGVFFVYYIFFDYKVKVVVFVCCGIFGFEDVLVDMMCDYDDFVWCGKVYKVYKGVYVLVKWLFYGGDGRVFNMFK